MVKFPVLTQFLEFPCCWSLSQNRFSHFICNVIFHEMHLFYLLMLHNLTLHLLFSSNSIICQINVWVNALQYLSLISFKFRTVEEQCGLLFLLFQCPLSGNSISFLSWWIQKLGEGDNDKESRPVFLKWWATTPLCEGSCELPVLNQGYFSLESLRCRRDAHLVCVINLLTSSMKHL